MEPARIPAVFRNGVRTEKYSHALRWWRYTFTVRFDFVQLDPCFVGFKYAFSIFSDFFIFSVFHFYNIFLKRSSTIIVDQFRSLSSKYLYSKVNPSFFR